MKRNFWLGSCALLSMVSMSLPGCGDGDGGPQSPIPAATSIATATPAATAVPASLQVSFEALASTNAITLPLNGRPNGTGSNNTQCSGDSCKDFFVLAKSFSGAATLQRAFEVFLFFPRVQQKEEDNRVPTGVAFLIAPLRTRLDYELGPRSTPRALVVYREIGSSTPLSRAWSARSGQVIVEAVGADFVRLRLVNAVLDPLAPGIDAQPGQATGRLRVNGRLTCPDPEPKFGPTP